MRKVLGRAVVLMLCAFTGAQVSADSKHGTFDPETCWQDSGGKIIVRLISGKAFAFEPSNFTIRVGWDPISGTDLPPEGCPGYPLVAKSIRFPNWPAWPAADAAIDKPTNPLERLQIFGHGGPVHLQKNALKLFEFNRLQYGEEHCEVLPGQLEVCRACTRAPNTTDQCRTGASEESNRPKAVGYDRVPANYRARPGAYFEHNGLPFAGGCTWPVWIDTPRWCQFRYQLEDGISIRYKINDWRVPETEFIAYDRKIRAMILSARAPQHDASPEEMEQFQ